MLVGLPDGYANRASAMNELIGDVRYYVKELEKDSVVNTTHHILRRLYARYGEDKVHTAIDDEFRRRYAVAG